MSAHSMTPAAASAAPSTTNAHRRPTRNNTGSCSRKPAISALMPTTDAPAPNAIAAYPSAAFTGPLPSAALGVAGVDLRRRVVGAVLDEDPVGVERRRHARGRCPVALAHDRRAVLE